MANKMIKGSKRPGSATPELRFSIPLKLLQEFGTMQRIILKPYPPGLMWLDLKMVSKLKPQVIEEIGKSFDVVLMPKTDTRVLR